MSTTTDSREIERFNALAGDWWNPEGDLRPLHMMNPVRITYIRDKLAEHFSRDPTTAMPLKGLRILDIGCGGGLLSEPMARFGARVTGLDAAANNIRIARAHARESGLDIDYRHDTAETLAAGRKRFDAILNMEVVEHVSDRALFIKSSCRLLKPGGAMVVSTLNRTLKSFALAIVGAEYVLHWLPRGSHQWEKFVRPDELTDDLRRNGVEVADLTGIVFNPLSGAWRESSNMAVNYLAYARKEKGK